MSDNFVDNIWDKSSQVKKVCILIQISLNFVPMDPVFPNLAFFQIVVLTWKTNLITNESLHQRKGVNYIILVLLEGGGFYF